MSDTVAVCPECDSSAIQAARDSFRGKNTNYNWHCYDCGERFDDEKIRERKRGNTIRGDSLAAKLDAADVDEVGL